MDIRNVDRQLHLRFLTLPRSDNSQRTEVIYAPVTRGSGYPGCLLLFGNYDNVQPCKARGNVSACSISMQGYLWDNMTWSEVDQSIGR